MHDFYPAMLCTARTTLSQDVSLSVRPPVTMRHCVKTAKHVEILSQFDNPIVLVCWEPNRVPKFHEVVLNKRGEYWDYMYFRRHCSMCVSAMASHLQTKAAIRIGKTSVRRQHGLLTRKMDVFCFVLSWIFLECCESKIDLLRGLSVRKMNLATVDCVSGCSPSPDPTGALVPGGIFGPLDLLYPCLQTLATVATSLCYIQQIHC